MDYIREYRRWMNNIQDEEIKDLLEGMGEAEIEDSFYRELEFGTGGLRGVIGAGTNRMNIYTVSKATQGLANYIKKEYGRDASVAIGYDSRIKSDVFAHVAASVFAANGIKVWLWPYLSPVPTLSYATRYLKCAAGVMITASHNPSKYNGYKVYNHDGCQITTEAAAAIYEEIEKTDVFADIVAMDFGKALKEGIVRYIDDSVMTAYIEEVKSQSVLFGDEIDRNVAIIYSPLNGAGYVPVTRTLEELGYNNVTIVEEQKLPDGNFPTCPFPNPEVKEALQLGLEYCKRYNADLMLATDPDCDRVGIAVKNAAGEYQLLTGNEVGILLLDYICSQRKNHNRMPEDPIMIKTIVTTDLAERIAAGYGVRTINVLTGFKFIGEQIGYLEQAGRENSYIFGFEESYGYLTGGYVRDKDGVNGASMICEMFAYYKTRGISLIDKLDELFAKFGYSMNTLHSYQFEGSAGKAKMDEIMRCFHEQIGVGCEFAGKKIIKVEDYSKGLNGLPKSDVIKYLLEGESSFVVRPSGTEPKLKIYISVAANNRNDSQTEELEISKAFEKIIKE